MLQNISGVSLVESMPNVPEAENRAYLRVICSVGAETGRDISTALVHAGLSLYEIRRVSATLEDVFLQLTTEEKNLPPEVESTVQEGEAA